MSNFFVNRQIRGKALNDTLLLIKIHARVFYLTTLPMWPILQTSHKHVTRLDWHSNMIAYISYLTDFFLSLYVLLLYSYSKLIVFQKIERSVFVLNRSSQVSKMRYSCIRLQKGFCVDVRTISFFLRTISCKEFVVKLMHL